MLPSHVKAITILLFLSAVLPALFPADRSFADEPFDTNNSAVRLLQKGEYEKALALLQKTFSLFPYNDAVRNNLASAYAALAKRQLEEKRFDEAAGNFEQALKLTPDNRDFSILRGIALHAGKHYDEAIIVLDQARHAGGDSPTLLFYLGKAYYDSGNMEGALEAWDKALALEPGNKTLRDMAEKARREYAVESPMGRGYRSLFVISYDGGTGSDLVQSVLEQLDTAFNRVGSDFDYYPTARVPVILYTRKDFRDITHGPDWSGGIYDGKVRLPIGGAAALTPVLRGVLFHEYAHVVVGELTNRNCPVWLNEGLAEVEGRREYDPPLAALASAVKRGKLLPFADLEKSMLGLNAHDAALAYQQSYSLARYLVSSYGWHKVRELLVNLGTGKSFADAFSAAFGDYGLDYPKIVEAWKETVGKEYGN